MLTRQYLIIPSDTSVEDISARIKKRIAKHDIACILLDTDDENELRGYVNALQDLSRQNNIALLIRDRYDLARELELDGVHITGNAETLKKAREELGSDYSIGGDAGTSRHTAMLLGEAGADYIAFSGDDDLIIEMCAWWSPLFQIPCVAFFKDDHPSINHKAQFDFYTVILKG